MKSPLKADLDEIWSLALSLSTPRDYERGLQGVAPVIPENILVFCRSGIDHLLTEPTRLRHHRFVLLVVLEGQGRLFVNEQIHLLTPGSVFLIFPFQFHHYLEHDAQDLRWIFITFESRRETELESLRNMIWKLDAVIRRQVLEIVRLVSGGSGDLSPQQVGVAQVRLGLVLAQLLLQQAELSAPPQHPDSIEGAALLEAVNRFFNRNVGHPFTLKELAQAIGYSPSHLRSIFRSAVGISLGQYISQARLMKATGLLHRGGKSISEVAEACGYASLFSFSRAFRKAYGCSAREFRKRCESDPKAYAGFVTSPPEGPPARPRQGKGSRTGAARRAKARA